MALPVPYAFPVIVIQVALLVAVHAQVVAAVTATFPFVATEVDRVDDVGAMAAVLVMDQPDALARQERERAVVHDLVARLSAEPGAMEPSYRLLHERAPDDAARLRVVVDQVACLTDAAAWGLHGRSAGVPPRT